MSLRDELIELMAAAICFESGDPMTEVKSHTGSATVALELALSHLDARGLQIVPKEPTKEMVYAGANRVRQFNQYEKPGMAEFDAEMERFDKDKTAVRAANVARAAIAAAPNPLTEEQNDD